MSERRQPRTERRNGVRIILTPRDHALVAAVGRFRLVRTSDLKQLFFPGRHRDVCATRLRKLFDSGWLDIRIGELAAENAYGLGPMGRRWLAERGERVWAVPRGDVRHHLAIVHVWALLAVAIHASAGLRMVRFTPDWQLRSESRGVDSAAVADALIEIHSHPAQGETRATNIILEVDRGTEWLPVLRSKLAAHVRALAFTAGIEGVPSPLLAVVLQQASALRVEAVRRLITTVWPDSAVVWTGDDAMLAWLAALATPVPTPAADPRRGNGSGGAVSPSHSAPPRVAGGASSEDED